MRQGSAYFLNEVSLKGENVYLSYTELDTGEKQSISIKCYKDNSPNIGSERWVSTVYKFFRNKVGRYFAVGEDIYEHELDFMKEPRSDEPFIMRFANIGKEELDFQIEWLKRDSLKFDWNKVVFNSFSTGSRIKYYPRRVL